MSSDRKPVRPRDAASLVIHRRARGALEVLMGRRSDRARFKPGMYVFPGGGLEASDHRVKPSSTLDESVVARLAVGGSATRAAALAHAAIRETYEEVGVMVGEAGDIGPSKSSSWQAFRAQGLAPPLGALAYLGRAITPSVQPIRFHARFFAVDAQYAQGEPRPSGELTDVQWVRLDAVANLELMPVTLLMLDALARQIEADDRRAAFLSFQHGRRQIAWI